MNRKLQVAIMVVSALALAAAQESPLTRQGDTWVQITTGTLPAAKVLKLTTDLGSVNIQGGDQSIIRYTVRKQVRAASEEQARELLNSVRVSAGENNGTAVLRGQALRSHLQDLSTDFTVEAPANLELVEAQTGGGALNVSDIRGRVQAQTGGGALQLSEIGGAISGSSGGGAVDVKDAGSDVKIQTGGGAIHVVSARGTIQASSGGGNIGIDSGNAGMSLETGGGNITVQSCGGNLSASTGGGTIAAGEVRGRADLETGGGAIRLSSAGGAVHVQSGGGPVELHGLASGAQAETGGGSIVAEFVGPRSHFTASRLETAGGDIRVMLPANLAVNVDAAIDMADGHSIYSDFSDLKIVSEANNFGPKESYCHGKLNGGGPTLHVHTTTGNIELLRTAAVKQQRR